MNNPSYVYRVFDVDGDLLYVGCSNNVERRVAQHRGEAEWFPLMASVAVEGPYDRRHALSVEREAARHESPQFGYTSELHKTRAHIRNACADATSSDYEALIRRHAEGRVSKRDWIAELARLRAIAAEVEAHYAQASGLDWALVDYSEPVAA